MKQKNPVLRFFTNLDLYIAMTGLVMLIFLTFFGTFARYLLNAPFVWQEEIQMILIVWIVFWGASAAFRSQNHIAIEILVDALPAKAQTIIRVIVDVAITFALMFIIYVEFTRVIQLFASGRSTSILKIPQAYNYAGIVLACVFMLVNFIAAEVKNFCSSKEEGEEK